MAELEALAREKELEIGTLTAENKQLAVKQRSQERYIEAQATLKACSASLKPLLLLHAHPHGVVQEEWPAKITALQEELLSYQDRLRKLRSREQRGHETVAKQQEQIVQ